MDNKAMLICVGYRTSVLVLLFHITVP